MRCGAHAIKTHKKPKTFKDHKVACMFQNVENNKKKLGIIGIAHEEGV